MLTVILIPARWEEPLHLVQVGTEQLATFQNLVGGPIDAINLHEPEASFFINDESKLLGQELNQRATTLLWAHNRIFHGQDLIMGPAVLHGPVGPQGESTSVPEEFVQLLLHTRRFQIERALGPDDPFTREPDTYGDWQEAYLYGLSLIKPDGAGTRMRVVAAEQ